MPDIVNAKTDDVEKALKVFNANNSVEAANNFLQAIYKADFLDEEIILPTDATTSRIVLKSGIMTNKNMLLPKIMLLKRYPYLAKTKAIKLIV